MHYFFPSKNDNSYITEISLILYGIAKLNWNPYEGITILI